MRSGSGGASHRGANAPATPAAVRPMNSRRLRRLDMADSPPNARRMRAPFYARVRRSVRDGEEVAVRILEPRDPRAARRGPYAGRVLLEKLIALEPDAGLGE